ncbi:hypothetical protein F2Q68_00015097 [Brassica cretica]|uniref:Uncharacterized protein n=1 Tax=Brassica cretica TaxID=69181 RepID=A0A8S9HR09_BRACR|nr:hypothetical protein F2Q68_00015097 [Brassica cretica]
MYLTAFVLCYLIIHPYTPSLLSSCFSSVLSSQLDQILNRIPLFLSHSANHHYVTHVNKERRLGRQPAIQNRHTIHPLTAPEKSCRLIRIISTDAFHQKPSSRLRKQPTKPDQYISSNPSIPEHCFLISQSRSDRGGIRNNCIRTRRTRVHQRRLEMAVWPNLPVRIRLSLSRFLSLYSLAPVSSVRSDQRCDQTESQ